MQGALIKYKISAVGWPVGRFAEWYGSDGFHASVQGEGGFGGVPR